MRTKLTGFLSATLDANVFSAFSRPVFVVGQLNIITLQAFGIMATQLNTPGTLYFSLRFNF